MQLFAIHILYIICGNTRENVTPGKCNRGQTKTTDKWYITYGYGVYLKHLVPFNYKVTV